MQNAKGRGRDCNRLKKCMAVFLIEEQSLRPHPLDWTWPCDFLSQWESASMIQAEIWDALIPLDLPSLAAGNTKHTTEAATKSRRDPRIHPASIASSCPWLSSSRSPILVSNAHPPGWGMSSEVVSDPDPQHPLQLHPPHAAAPGPQPLPPAQRSQNSSILPPKQDSDSRHPTARSNGFLQ